MAIASASGSVFVPASTSEPIKHKEPKASVIEDEKDRMELSPAYKRYLSFQRGYDDVRHQFDVDNLTYEEYAEMCGMLKEKGMLKNMSGLIVGSPMFHHLVIQSHFLKKYLIG